MNKIFLSLMLLAAGNVSAQSAGGQGGPIADIQSQAQQANNMLKAACDTYKQGNSNALVNFIGSQILGAGNLDQLRNMGAGLCRISEMSNNITGMLSQDNWKSFGIQMVSNALGNIKGLDGNVVDIAKNVMNSLASGSFDAQQMMTSIGDAYMANAMKQTVTSTVQVGTDGQGNPVLEQVTSDLPIGAGAAAAAMDGNTALQGTASVYIGEQQSSDALETTASRLAAVNDTAMSVLGNPAAALAQGDPSLAIGSAAQRVNDVSTAASLREQMIANVKTGTDIMTQMATYNPAIVSQLAENAKLQSNTNHLLAVQTNEIYKKQLAESQRTVAAYKAKVKQEYDNVSSMRNGAVALASLQQEVAAGPAIQNFSWDDMVGVGN